MKWGKITNSNGERLPIEVKNEIMQILELSAVIIK